MRDRPTILIGVAAAFLVLLFGVVAVLRDDGSEGDPGSTVASSSSTTTTRRKTTTTVSQDTDPVVLAAGGLRVVSFGTDYDAAVREMRSHYGPPTHDTGWVGSNELGKCPGEHVRAVEWGALRLLFTDGSTPFHHQVGRHLFSWDYGRAVDDVASDTPHLETSRGLAIGDDVKRAKKLHPGTRLVSSGDELDALVIPGAGGDLYAYLGADTDVIITLAAGPGCGAAD